MGVPGFDILIEVLNTALGDDLPSTLKWQH
jgi:hypothetical protein